MAHSANSVAERPRKRARVAIRYAVVPFVQQGSRMVAEDIHYLDTYRQAQAVAKFVSARRPGVLVLSVSPALEGGDPEIVVLDQIGAGLASATATVH